MVEQVLDALALGPGARVLDLTLGGGGHVEAIFEREPSCEVLGVDRDAETLARTSDRLKRYGERFQTVHARYDEWDREAPQAVSSGLWDGILLDLGISSLQLDDPERGFGFDTDALLDMRMDRARGETAADLLRRLSERQIADLLFQYGDERRSRAIARRIVERRRAAPLRRTQELAELVVRVYGGRGRSRIHPATRTFQALRIAVNDEFAALENVLQRIPNWLAPGGRVVVLSFHSGEDRRVKHALLEHQRAGRLQVLTKKPMVPDASEVARNRRSRSAKLRAAERRLAEAE